MDMPMDAVDVRKDPMLFLTASEKPRAFAILRKLRRARDEWAGEFVVHRVRIHENCDYFIAEFPQALGVLICIGRRLGLHLEYEDPYDVQKSIEDCKRIFLNAKNSMK